MLYVVFLIVAGGARILIQRRRTGDSGMRFDAGPAGGAHWWVRTVLLAAIALSATAPLAGMAGLDPLPLLDSPVLRWTGAVVAMLGIAATAASQLAMGDSWRIGVDPNERTALVTGGPFALIRNPIFTAFLTSSAGFMLMTGNILGVLGFVILVAAVEAQVRVMEEPYLREAHGAQYAAYAARVGRFVPYLGRVRH